MAKLLFIQASPRMNRSHSIGVGREFIDSYHISHPADTIKTINLFDYDMPELDDVTIQGKYNIIHGREYSPQEKEQWLKVVEVIEDFKDADKYLFAVPMWNFSIPYKLKHYLDVIIQPNYTFQITEKGYEGLSDQPAVIIHARRGDHSETSDSQNYDLQKPYLELVLGFIGIHDTRRIIIEPTLHGGEDVAQQVQRNAIAAAREIAATF